MAGNLIIPRMRVTWGDINLSSYNGKGQFPAGEPLVYDVEVQLQSQTQNPTGTMKWNPTGPGFSIYEQLISSEDYLSTRIFVDILYFGGKKLRMAFLWAGQTINYGNDMSVTVTLKTELDGLINSNIRGVSQAFDEKSGGAYIDSIERLKKQFQITDPKLVRYTEKANKDLTRAKILTNYGNDQTFGAALANTVQQNGNTVFANTIEEPNLVVYTPYSWDKDVDVLDGATAIGVDQGPKPDKRYGYILGPAIITSISRKAEWQPPQQTTQNNPNTQIRARDQKTGRFIKGTPATLKQQDKTAAATSSPLGTANARPNPGIQNKDNPDGPTKQNLLTQEGTSTLNLQTFVCPLLVGIKPYDIIYLPSLKGDYIEDWVVENVNYDQSDGNISVSISAKRQLGLGTPMNEKNAAKFTKIALQNNLIGPNATLAAWEKYAWSLRGK